jgi:leukotriene-A4 hydrolase
MLSLKDGVNKVVFDLKNISVSKVVSDATEQNFVLNKSKGENYPLGTPLEVSLSKTYSKGEKFNLTVYFSTTNKSEAIQWLTSNQTKGKTYPFMFAQCEAILCRSLLPCQVIFPKAGHSISQNYCEQ